MTTRELLFLRYVLTSNALKPAYRDSDDVAEAQRIIRDELNRRCRISDANRPAGNVVVSHA